MARKKKMTLDEYMALTPARPAALSWDADGEGAVNGVGVKKGDRLIVCGERNMDVQGDVALVVCA